MNDKYPGLATRLPRTRFADLPTPVVTGAVMTARGSRKISIKRDDLTGQIYGGNKVRKLEYLLRRARDRQAGRIATFGTVASNHALATALYSSSLGFDCTCLLTHQTRTPNCPRVLNMHLQNGTEIVRFGGKRADMIDTMRDCLQGRNTWVVPAGGSNWLGAVAFVNAGLELAAQIAAGELDAPARIYVANGTMGTSAGLALGLALAGLPSEVHAIRVTHSFVANPQKMRALMTKTAALLHALDAAIPANLAETARLVFRDEFFGGGYARSYDAADRAVAVARDELGLSLETTYTGKSMAAVLQDLEDDGDAAPPVLFWNTYNSRPLPAASGLPADTSGLPDEFLRYYS